MEEYVNYFGGLDDFNDSFDWNGSNDQVEVEVSWGTFDTGATHVSVDAGGDEASMDYLVGRGGQLIAHYQHNQSPDHTLYCDGGDEYLEDGECFFEYIENFPHVAADERNVTATVTSSTASSQPEKAISVAVQAYAAELGLSSNVTINVDATLWDLGGQDSAGRVRVKASGERTFVYELSAHANTQFQFSVKRGNRNKAYDCKEL